MKPTAGHLRKYIWVDFYLINLMIYASYIYACTRLLSRKAATQGLRRLGMLPNFVIEIKRRYP